MARTEDHGIMEMMNVSLVKKIVVERYNGRVSQPQAIVPIRR